MTNERGRTPWWVWAVCAVMALSQIAVIAVTRYAPPEGAVPTGLHIPDSALFLYSMKMFSTGFESVYATCQAGHGTHSIVYYAVPHLWLYGVMGALAQLLHANAFLSYGVANGVGAFLYLFAIFRFLEEVFPRQSRLAYLLFVLSGGLGGVLYLFSELAGWTRLGHFESYFFRFAIYELVEGPHLLPVTHFPRFYYTLSLALGFGALTQFHRSHQMRCGAHAFYASLLMFASAFLYFRLAAFLLGLVYFFLWAHPAWPLAQRVRNFAIVAAPAFLGGGLGALLLSLNPAVVENHLRVANMSMWWSPFLATAFLHLIVAGVALRGRIVHLPRFARVCAAGAVGYLVVFTILFVLYQIYYGNVLVARDGAVASRISDPALLGFVVGAAWAWRRKPGFANPENWVVLWFLGFLAVSISAFGQGWFLRFGPQRLELLLWLPLCILVAQGLQTISGTLGKGLLALFIFLGTVSVCASLLFFQSPLGRVGARGPYPNWHTEVMSTDDAAAMDAIGDGTVLALPPASDAIVARRGNPTVFGIGSFNLTDRSYLELQEVAETFFDADTSDSDRRAIARAWCVDYVYCSDTWPVDEDVLAALRATPWLEEVATHGQATVFRVKTEAFEDGRAAPVGKALS